jgi:hypothetical protein
MKPIVTVVMPVADIHVKYLPDALRSLTNQTIQAHKIIVANDTGKPLRINAGVKVVNTKGHQGAAIARNLAIEQVDTPFVFFLDADDMAVDVAIESLLRAYANPDYTANYLYGDSFHDNDYYPAYPYDRKFLLRSNIHTVTALVPTESIRSIGGFDEVIQGWEDWLLYIQLGVNGFCGERVPVPLILYRVGTGINREAHYRKHAEIYNDEQQLFADYISERIPLMGCCPKNSKATQAAQMLVNALPPDSVAGDEMVFEYLGTNQGAIPFRMEDGTVYRGANDPMTRFVKVKNIHAQELYNRGNWRQVPNSVLKARKPELPQVIQQNPILPSPPPVPQVEIKVCIECGHPRNFVDARGICQALEGDVICGCAEYIEEAVKVKRAPKARKMKESA